MNILLAILIGVNVVFAITLTLFVYKGQRRNDCNLNSVISFKESLDLIELPVVTMSSNSKKLHFLLDTGANINIIQEYMLSELEIEDKKESENSVTGFGSTTEIDKCCKITLSYNDLVFREEFEIMDIPNLDSYKGIKIHGILGSNFFMKYKYILDFEQKKFYRR